MDPSQRSHVPSFRPPALQTNSSVTFIGNERGDRAAPIHQHDARNTSRLSSSYVTQPLPPTPTDLAAAEEDGSAAARMLRKKSLVKPDRERIDPGHRQWYYRNHAAQLENQGQGRLGLLPSTTGNYPTNQPLRRGRSLLARNEEEAPESGLSIFKRGATLRRKRQNTANSGDLPDLPSPQKKRGCFDNTGPGPKDPWFIYCYILTCCVPSFLLSSCGIRTPEQQRAWREKMGLLFIIFILMGAVGFLTFGFTQTVCGKPPNRFQTGHVQNGSLIIHGYNYDFTKFNHPAVQGFFDGKANPVLSLGVGGMDASFLFQNVNEHCKGMITVPGNSSIPNSNGNLEWYFPCNFYNQFGTSTVNKTGYTVSTYCHITPQSRQMLARMKPLGQVYYNWTDVKNPARQLTVYESSVLDLSLLQWLDRSQVTFPREFDALMQKNNSWIGKDISMPIVRTKQKALARCLQDLVTVGFIDTNSIGCVASEVVLYVSLVFIIGVVAIRFAMAVLFGWFLSWQLGTFKGETYEQRMRRAAEVEAWTDDIYRPAPANYRPTATNGLTAGKGLLHKKRDFLPSTSRFSRGDILLKGAGSRPVTAYGNLDPASFRKSTYSMYGKTLTPPDSAGGKRSRSSTSLERTFVDSTCPFPLYNVVPQPPPDYEPFNFPLVHTICLVTAYSESIEALRTTMDSVATTDYPNSHKLIMVIADGMVKGSGNDKTTPELILTMMKDFVVPPEDVDPHSYVAIADGYKRHNMAKVFAGFYEYDDRTVEKSKQQKVPVVLVAKVGNPHEATDAKPGNRGKRDSQIVLMGFLQKVMFDERMTTFEYEFFNSIWRVSGVCPDRYELVLCVDADTKVFPDSLTRMVSCMVNDEEIMGLCGETKIANKSETWVTMIQVFEYYISHHLTKAFESVFGGVTCLPGCFSMYRIKAPKGATGYWVPILANPDIVEHYSENIVDTLHKKNLLLLGEDRYLSTLMLKTFPKRKMIFCPQAVCKTIVPDTFRVLLSQRRRWINSTVHNLAELLLVRDLCGTFCFSMQFVVFMELTGTLVLPAAISFTIYLIIRSIIPGHTSTVIPLILLAIILGLPGVLIVVTSRKIAYLGWMLMYLVSLPVWNFVLPAYAFWHFDDFSWGQTRRLSGVKEGKDGGDKEGQFDSTNIVMKRWAEFERDRRWRTGTQSRDSTFNPKRYSLASMENSYPQLPHQSFPQQGFDMGSPPHLGLPAQRNGSPASRRSEEIGYSHSSSAQRLIPSPAGSEAPDTDPDHAQTLTQSSVGSDHPAVYTSPTLESQLSRTAGMTSMLRPGAMSREYPGETQNPYRYSQPHAAQAQTVTYGEAFPTEGSVAEIDSVPASRSRGVSLVDHGVVPSADGVRRVARQTARRSTQGLSQPTPQSPPPTSSRYSRTSMSASSLPPGAAPPVPQQQQYRFS